MLRNALMMAKPGTKAPASAKKKTAKKRGTAKKKTKRMSRAEQVIDRISSDEATQVLRELLVAFPDIHPTAVEIADRLMTGVNAEQIAEEVERSVLDLDLEVLGERAGRWAHGYVEPTEAAWEILQETVDPFVHNAVRLAELRHDEAAASACHGVLLGLYAVDDYQGDGVLQWAEDFPSEAAGDALSQVKRALGRRPGKAALLREIVAGMPNWSWLDREVRGR